LDDRPVDLRCSPLCGGADGVPPHLRVDDHEVWVAVTDTSGFGAGWFRCGPDLKPERAGWDLVDAALVLDRAGLGADEVARLTAAMVSTCLRDGFGHLALELADSLIDSGYSVEVSAAPSPKPVLT
jgi:hypothetical protein